MRTLHAKYVGKHMMDVPRLWPLQLSSHNSQKYISLNLNYSTAEIFQALLQFFLWCMYVCAFAQRYNDLKAS